MPLYYFREKKEDKKNTFVIINKQNRCFNYLSPRDFSISSLRKSTLESLNEETFSDKRKILMLLALQLKYVKWRIP